MKFGAVWCSGCLIMKPRWEKIEKEWLWLETEYYDVDDNQEIVKRFNINEYPCFIFLDKEGKEIERLYGEVAEEKLRAVIVKNKNK